MTIKEVAERYHLTQDTLRYYERVRMIPEVHRTSGESVIIRKRTCDGWNWRSA